MHLLTCYRFKAERHDTIMQYSRAETQECFSEEELAQLDKGLTVTLANGTRVTDLVAFHDAALEAA